MNTVRTFVTTLMMHMVVLPTMLSATNKPVVDDSIDRAKSSHVATINNKVDSHEDVVEPVLLASIPKAGTHLMSKIAHSVYKKETHWGMQVYTLDESEIQQLQPNTYYMLHAKGSQFNIDLCSRYNFKTLLIIRDPRDVLVSWARWLKNSPDNKEFYEHLDLNELLTNLIENFNLSHLKKRTIVDHFNSYLRWQAYGKLYITSFEKLVGAKGGGDDIVQKQEIIKIGYFLGVSVNEEEVEVGVQKLFGGTATFSEGQIGGWKKYLTEGHKNALKKVPGFNNLLKKLGYAHDSKW